MPSASRLDDKPPGICEYVCTVMMYLVGFAVLAIFYMNNSWLIVRDPTGSLEFQRGLNDDCVKNITSNIIKCTAWNKKDPFAKPFNNVVDPPILMYLAMYIARSLILLQFGCFLFSIACCCHDKFHENFCKKFDMRISKLIMWFLLAGASLYIILLLIMIICRFKTSTLRHIPSGFEESFGLGFYVFVVLGFILFLAGSCCFYWVSHKEGQPLSTNEQNAYYTAQSST